MQSHLIKLVFSRFRAAREFRGALPVNPQSRQADTPFEFAEHQPEDEKPSGRR